MGRRGKKLENGGSVQEPQLMGTIRKKILTIRMKTFTVPMSVRVSKQGFVK